MNHIMAALIRRPSAGNQSVPGGSWGGGPSRSGRIVPNADTNAHEPKQLALFVPFGQLDLTAITKSTLDKQLRDAAPRRLSWMKLLSRVFRIDISVCRRCQGPMRIVRAVTDPDEIAAELPLAPERSERAVW